MIPEFQVKAYLNIHVKRATKNLTNAVVFVLQKGITFII